MSKKKQKRLVVSIPDSEVDKDRICNAALEFINTVDTSRTRTLEKCYLELEEIIPHLREVFVRELVVLTKDEYNFNLAYVFGNFNVDRVLSSSTKEG